MCARIEQAISPDLLALARDVAAVAPDDWDTALVGYHRLVESLTVRSGSGTEDEEAARLAISALNFYEGATELDQGP